MSSIKVLFSERYEDFRGILLGFGRGRGCWTRHGCWIDVHGITWRGIVVVSRDGVKLAHMRRGWLKDLGGLYKHLRLRRLRRLQVI